MNEPKQVIVVRRDLGMSPGKLAAQVAHAAVTAARVSDYDEPDPYYDQWITGSQVKIVVGVDNEMELLEVFNDAQNAGIRRAIIKDEGRTELQGQNYTAVAVGPAASDDVNKITGRLKLL